MCTDALAADKVFVDCDGCSSTEMRASAIAAAPTNFGYTDVYVYNFTVDSILKYSVLKETEPGHEWTHVINKDVEQDIQGDFDKAVFTIQTLEIPATLRPIPVSGVYQSAFDVVNDTNAQRDLVSMVPNHFGISWVGTWVGGAFISVSTRLSNMSPVMHFEFPDGSILVFEATDFDPLSLTFTLVFLRGTDADGNAIHQTADGYSGDSGITVGEQSRDAHREFLGGLGLGTSVDFVDGACHTTLSCTWTCGPSNCTYACTRAC